ncbi:MAG: hypothetical protein RI911_799, partial [Candidatus Parcubacteria bacterium]
TVFNILGPFVNPASTKLQVIGVPSKTHLKLLPAVAQSLGYTRALIVHSEDGMDEISTRAKTHAVLISGKKSTKITIDPQKLGFKKPSLNALHGKDAAYNSGIIRNILNGEKGPQRDIVLLNTAAALFVSGAAQDIHSGIRKAAESIDSGHARKVLEDLVVATNAYKTL